jgi:hypothetical protein
MNKARKMEDKDSTHEDNIHKLFLPIMCAKKVKFESTKEKQDFLRDIEDHPDFEWVREKIEISIQMSNMILETKRCRGEETKSDGVDMALQISNELKRSIDFLELCNFIRLIAIMYNKNPTLVMTLMRDNAKESNYSSADYEPGVNSRSPYIHLTEQALAGSRIRVIGKNENLLHMWGSKAKVLLDKHGVGFNFLMVPKSAEAEFYKDRMAGDNRVKDIREWMITEISRMLAPRGTGPCRDLLDKSAKIYKTIEVSAEKHMLLHENRKQKTKWERNRQAIGLIIAKNLCRV